ncbi:MAG TPA: hypothetical protein VFX67_00040 [Burkholderiales bacterium]|nr:hypothetical protein [Burkholderiales bacterium]
MGLPAISLRKIRALDLAGPSSERRPQHLSAASGLAVSGRFLYVIADDELHLGEFPASAETPGRLIRLFRGELPEKPKARKRRKPDLEALTLLPPCAGHPHGALLALGSGSRPNRRGGALLALDARGKTAAAAQPCDLSGLLVPLEDRFAKLNIEGAVVLERELCLLQRGNRDARQNALIRFPLSPLLHALGCGLTLAALPPLAVHPVDLGEVDGVPLCFTDAAALPGGDLVFTAVAEDTGDNYHDGPCRAAAIGIVTRQGVVRRLHRLDHPHKVEGVHATVSDDRIDLLLVTDDDDPEIAACLYAARLADYRG